MSVIGRRVRGASWLFQLSTRGCQRGRELAMGVVSLRESVVHACCLRARRNDSRFARVEVCGTHRVASRTARRATNLAVLGSVSAKRSRVSCLRSERLSAPPGCRNPSLVQRHPHRTHCLGAAASQSRRLVPLRSWFLHRRRGCQTGV
jgi:hypothetical protein